MNGTFKTILTIIIFYLNIIIVANLYKSKLLNIPEYFYILLYYILALILIY